MTAVGLWNENQEFNQLVRDIREESKRKISTHLTIIIFNKWLIAKLIKLLVNSLLVFGKLIFKLKTHRSNLWHDQDGFQNFIAFEIIYWMFGFNLKAFKCFNVLKIKLNEKPVSKGMQSEMFWVCAIVRINDDRRKK